MYDNVSLNSSQNEKCFRQKMYRKSKHPFYVQLLFFPEIMWIMWKYIVKPDSLPMTLSRGACVLHAGYRYTLGICNTYCFSTATVVTRTRLNVTLHYIACLFQFFINCSNKEAWFHMSYFCQSGAPYTPDRCFHYGSDWANCATLLVGNPPQGTAYFFAWCRKSPLPSLSSPFTNHKKSFFFHLFLL